MEKYTLKIKTLTPIWTGNANKKNTTLRETGIIGNLRWWYEAIIRGLGLTACDPTKTQYNIKNHCDACELFGCTGWSRKFRLEVDFNQIIPEIEIGTRKKHNNKYLKRKVEGFMSTDSFPLNFIPLKNIRKNEWYLLNATLNIIENYGALGARISQGCGVVKIIENTLPISNTKINLTESSVKKCNVSPNFNDFFFYKYQLNFNDAILNTIDKHKFWTHNHCHKDFAENWNQWRIMWENYGFLPIAFHLRDSLRTLIDNKNSRKSDMGNSDKGLKLFVSHGYKIDENIVECRIGGYDGNDIVGSLQSKIEKDYELERSLKHKLFSNGNDELKSCKLKEKKTGKELLEELK